MSWSYPANCDVYYDDANYLDGVSQFSCFIRKAFHTINVGNQQHLIGHRGATNRWGFRKNNGTPEKPRFYVKSGGVGVSLEQNFTPIVDTQYSWAFAWKKNDANGIALWRDGANGVTGSTTTQTSDYDSGGSVDLYICAYANALNYGLAKIEELFLWNNHFLTTAQVALLHKGIPWHQIGGLPKPASWWEMRGEVLNRLPDLSGNKRSVESATIDAVQPPTDGGILYPRAHKRTLARPSSKRGGASEGGSPNPWDLWAETQHPVVAATKDGLTNAQVYELKVNAVDHTGNVSEDSDIVEETPTAPAPPTVSYRIPWKRPRRKSKYRSAQQ